MAAARRGAVPCSVANIKWSALNPVASEIAAVETARVDWNFARAGGSPRSFTSSSTAVAIFAIVLIAVIGCFPLAVSPESMTALAP